MKLQESIEKKLNKNRNLKLKKNMNIIKDLLTLINLFISLGF